MKLYFTAITVCYLFKFCAAGYYIDSSKDCVQLIHSTTGSCNPPCQEGTVCKKTLNCDVQNLNTIKNPLLNVHKCQSIDRPCTQTEKSHCDADHTGCTVQYSHQLAKPKTLENRAEIRCLRPDHVCDNNPFDWRKTQCYRRFQTDKTGIPDWLTGGLLNVTSDYAFGVYRKDCIGKKWCPDGMICQVDSESFNDGTIDEFAERCHFRSDPCLVLSCTEDETCYRGVHYVTNKARRKELCEPYGSNCDFVWPSTDIAKCVKKNTTVDVQKTSGPRGHWSYTQRDLWK